MAADFRSQVQQLQRQEGNKVATIMQKTSAHAF
jgi:hypothetical protein